MASTKNALKAYPVIVDGDMSGNITSTVTNIQFMDNIGYQIAFTGTPEGTFEVQVSIDHMQDSQGVVTVPGTWVAVALSPSPVASGAADQIYIDLNQLSAPWVRLYYEATTSTGVCNAFICGKSV